MPAGLIPLGEPMDILYEDDAILAVDKPAGLHVFPSRRGERQSLWTRLKTLRPELEGVGDPETPAITHRLDRGTSGILLVAKNDRAYQTLRKAFESGEVDKVYVALVEGVLSKPVEVDLSIGSRYRRSTKVQVQLPGKRLRGVRPARTSVNPLASASGLTLCHIRIRTGVRHQIRAHLGHLGHPLVGDFDYGAHGEMARLENRLFLHAWMLKLRHPDSGSPLRIVCPLPGNLAQMLEKIGLAPPAGP